MTKFKSSEKRKKDQFINDTEGISYKCCTSSAIVNNAYPELAINPHWQFIVETE